MDNILHRYSSESSVEKEVSSQEKSSDGSDGSDDFHVINVTDANETNPNEDVSAAIVDAESAAQSQLNSSVGGRVNSNGDRNLPELKPTASENVAEKDHQKASLALSIEEQNENLRKWVQCMVPEKRKQGTSFIGMIRKNKNFRNPAIFEKMISYCEIDEFGSHVQGRRELGTAENYLEISEAQERYMQQDDV